MTVLIELDETPSTNSWVAAHAGELADMTMVTARRQSAGRGQRGNSWESEPGQNLTFSLLARPVSVPAREQFSISEAAALAIADALGRYGIDCKVKWPNDIYCGDRKICGILIEHVVMGTGLMHSIIGAGLNVNQTRFVSDAPNPVSMAQVAGHAFDLGEVRDVVARCVESRLAAAETAGGRAGLHSEFLGRLYRGDSRMHTYRDRDSGETFEARIAGVEPQGLLHLCDSAGCERVYAFKEVEFVLPSGQ